MERFLLLLQLNFFQTLLQDAIEIWHITTFISILENVKKFLVVNLTLRLISSYCI